MINLNTSRIILDYNPIAARVAEQAVSSLVGSDGQKILRTRLLGLQRRLSQKSGIKFTNATQQLRGNVRGGELFDFTFSGWVRNLVSSVAETENTMTNLINKNGPELVTIYNTVAKLLGEKEVNRFATKSAAVDRTARLLAMLNGKRHDIYEKTLVDLGLQTQVVPGTGAKLAAAVTEAPKTVELPTKAAVTAVIEAAAKVVETGKALPADGIDATEDKAHAKALTEVAAPKAPAVTKPAAKASVVRTNGAKAPGRPRDFNFKPFSVHRIPRAGSFLAEALALLTKGCQYADMIQLVNDMDAKRGRGTLAKGSDSVDRRAYELIRDLHFLNGYGIKHNQDNGLLEAYTFVKG